MTERQKQWVDLKMTNRPVSAILGRAADCERSEVAQAHLKEARKELQDITQITRADVVQGILEAINRAKQQSEPSTEINGWKEIGKLLGHYAQEKERQSLTDDQNMVLRKLETLSTAELLKLAAKKKALTIDGEAQRVQ